MKNIRLVLLGELLLFIIVFVISVLTCSGGTSNVVYFIDLPSILLVLAVLVPGLMVMGVWGDFTKAFSVGINKYSLLELKNIIGAVGAAQKLTAFGALFAILVSSVVTLGKLDDMSTLGPNLAVIFLSGFYAVLIEFFLLPLRLNAERRMNEEMDFGDE